MEDSGADVDTYVARLSRYLAPLSRGSNAPYSEIGFVNRVGTLGVGYGAKDGDVEGDWFSISYVGRKSGSDHVFSMGFSRDDTDSIGPGENRGDDSEESFFFRYSRYLPDNSSVGASLNVERADPMTAIAPEIRIPSFEGYPEGWTRYSPDEGGDFPFIGLIEDFEIPRIVSRSSVDGIGLTVSGWRLFDLGSDQWFTLSGELGYLESDADLSLSQEGSVLDQFSHSVDILKGEISGRYYFNQRTSLSGTLGLIDADGSDTTLIGLALEVFLSETVVAAAGIVKADPSGPAPESDAYFLMGGFRFKRVASLVGELSPESRRGGLFDGVRLS
ncbi:MAG: hypothetical protein AAGB46_02575 [Verrucomicrobiota bacterium]